MAIGGSYWLLSARLWKFIGGRALLEDMNRRKQTLVSWTLTSVLTLALGTGAVFMGQSASSLLGASAPTAAVSTVSPTTTVPVSGFSGGSDDQSSATSQGLDN